MASIFLLIFLDLLESGSDRWNVHLEGAKSLISLNSPLGIDDPGQTVQEIRNFIATQIYLYVLVLQLNAHRLTSYTELKLLGQPLSAPSYSPSLLPRACYSKTQWNSRSLDVQNTF